MEKVHTTTITGMIIGIIGLLLEAQMFIYGLHRRHLHHHTGDL
jgi:hypothetical protein